MVHKNKFHFGLSYSTDFHRMFATRHVLQEQKHHCWRCVPWEGGARVWGLCRPCTMLEAQEAWAWPEPSVCSFLGQKRGRDHNPAASVLGASALHSST